MLEPLLECLDTGEFDDNGFVLIRSVEHRGGGNLDLQLETGIYGEPASQTWLISCASVRDFRLLPRLGTA
jgi:hypothetical protein